MIQNISFIFSSNGMTKLIKIASTSDKYAPNCIVSEGFSKNFIFLISWLLEL